MIWVFRHLAMLPSRFCQISVSLYKVEPSKCMSIVNPTEVHMQMGHPVDVQGELNVILELDGDMDW